MNVKAIVCACLLTPLLVACGGGSKEELLAKGLAEIKKANPNGAMVYFKSALERDSNYFESRHELAKAFLAVGKTELAEMEFIKLIKQNPQRDDLKIELARTYLLNQKPEPAMLEIGEYIQKHGATSETHELTGIAAVMKNQPAAAEASLLLALAADPARTKVKRELATVYVKFRMKEKDADARRLIAEIIQAEPKETTAYYLLAEIEAVAGNKEQVLAHFKTIADINPADFNAQYKVGAITAGGGDLATAAQIADTLTKKFPKRGEGPRLEGIVHYDKGDFGQAIAKLLLSQKLSPTDEAIYYLGLSYYRKGDLESALSQFYKLADNTVFAEPSRLLVGVILLSQRRLDDAIRETKKLLALQPGHALGHNILGSALMAKGQFDEGMKELTRAIELDPGIVDAHLKKGVFHLSSGLMQDAERDFSAAVQAAPSQLNTRQVLSAFYLRQSQPEKAIEILSKGLARQKGDAVLYDNLAAVRFFQNKRPEGLAYLLKAREVDPDYTAAAFHLAAYYSSEGQPEQALTEYRRLLEKNPKNTAALLRMAGLLEYLDREAEALEAYQRAKGTGENAAYLALAGYFMRKSRDADALAVTDEAIKAIARNLDAREVKYRIHQQRGEYKEALKTAGEIESLDAELGLQRTIGTYIAMKDESKALDAAKQYITLHPNLAIGYLMQAMVYERWNEFDQAVDAVKSGIRAQPESITAMIQLGDVYARRKNYAAAQEAYAAAQRKDPNAAAVVFAQGALLDEMGKKPEAIKKYQEVLEKADNNVPALNNLAYLYVTGYGSQLEGLRLAILGARQEPGNPMVLDTLGLALLKNGRAADACKILEKAAVQLPEMPTVAYHLALAYRDAGMNDKALKVLSGIATRRDYPEAEDASKIFNSLSRAK